MQGDWDYGGMTFVPFVVCVRTLISFYKLLSVPELSSNVGHVLVLFTLVHARVTRPVLLMETLPLLQIQIQLQTAKVERMAHTFNVYVPFL